jgi:hypothetical protein
VPENDKTLLSAASYDPVVILICGGRAIELGGRPIDALREKALSYCIPTQIQNLIPGHSGIFLLNNE